MLGEGKGETEDDPLRWRRFMLANSYSAASRSRQSVRVSVRRVGQAPGRSGAYLAMYQRASQLFVSSQSKVDLGIARDHRGAV